ncbi:MAG: leucine-rich repeat protein [Ruminococcus sp.]|nr:leucine-rich repeat protein [Ruminococcus sp.]
MDGTSATETLSVVIYEAVSDEDAARMAEITQLVNALLDDEAFQEADQETRKQMADEMFAEMDAEGYVKEGPVEYNADTYWYTYLCESVGGLSDVECILDIAIKEPNQVYSGSETDASCFTYTNHGDSIEITGFDNSVSDVVIPSEMEDLPVTTIGNMAFFGSSIISLVMPNTVTVIDDYAFMGCEALTDVTFSENLTTISFAAFSNCTSLSEVTLPQSVTSLEFSAFSKCTALTAVMILNADCEIYDSASTISNGSVLDASSEDVQQIPYYNGTIYGYADSTAQTYAETYGFTFAAIETPSTTITTVATTETITTTASEKETSTTEAKTTTSTEITTQSTTSSERNSMIGDVNLDGSVSLADSIFLNKYVAGLVDLSDIAFANADTNADGYVDADDALVLLKFQVQLVNSIPVVK